MSDDEFEQPEHQIDLPEFDAGDPAAVGKRKRTIEIKERESKRFWELVFATPVGRREMYCLLTDCHAFEDRFACGPNGFPQPEATWFQAGESAWGRRIVQTWMVAHADQYALMLRENDPRFQKDKK